MLTAHLGFGLELTTHWCIELLLTPSLCAYSPLGFQISVLAACSGFSSLCLLPAQVCSLCLLLLTGVYFVCLLPWGFGMVLTLRCSLELFLTPHLGFSLVLTPHLGFGLVLTPHWGFGLVLTPHWGFGLRSQWLIPKNLLRIPMADPKGSAPYPNG